MARPTKYNKEIAGRLAEMIGEGFTIKDSCRFCDVSDDTFGRWRKRYSDFNASIIQASNRQWLSAQSFAKYCCRSYKRKQTEKFPENRCKPMVCKKDFNFKSKSETFMGLPIRYEVPRSMDEIGPYFNVTSNQVEWIDDKKIFHTCSRNIFEKKITQALTQSAIVII